MVYAPLSNYKYDTGTHRIQSGPAHEGYLVVSSGIVDTGADLGVITNGSPNSSGWYQSPEWRSVPVAPSGFWTDYSDAEYSTGEGLSVYQGYRGLTTTTIANAKVSTSSGPTYGLRDSGKYTYFGGAAPTSQSYTPYNTPAGNSAAEGSTGGTVTHGRYENSILTNVLGSQGTSNRSEWVYNPPVYCRTYTEISRSQSPGLMSSFVSSVYRGGAAQYTYNYGAGYYQLPESVRSMVRTYSTSVNSSNQRG